MHGALRCLALFAGDLDDIQLPPLIPVLFPALYSIVSASEVWSFSDTFLQSCDFSGLAKLILDWFLSELCILMLLCSFLGYFLGLDLLGECLQLMQLSSLRDGDRIMIQHWGAEPSFYYIAVYPHWGSWVVLIRNKHERSCYPCSRLGWAKLPIYCHHLFLLRTQMTGAFVQRSGQKIHTPFLGLAGW